MADTGFQHVPVLLEACLRGLDIKPNGIYVDCTAGGAGHSCEILARLGADGCLFAFDKDPEARAAAEARLKLSSSLARWEIIPADFARLGEELIVRGITQVDGILADLGVSSHQLDIGERGFSFRFNGPLDMRMNPGQDLTAAQLLAEWSEADLAHIFRLYGEERYAGNIARNIVRSRAEQPLATTDELVDLILRSIPPAARREKQHPAKRVFQALRIAVNDELKALEKLLEQAPLLLKEGGNLVIISFHSLEDRLVKQAYRTWEHPCTCPRGLPCICGQNPLGRAQPAKGEVAAAAELERNPRSRSARVRTFVFQGAEGEG